MQNVIHPIQQSFQQNPIDFSTGDGLVQARALIELFATADAIVDMA